MAELVTDCPRCNSKSITFSLLSSVIISNNGWENYYEVFSICRHCKRATIFVLSDSFKYYQYIQKVGLTNIEGSVNDFVHIEGFITIKDIATIEPPYHIPDTIERVFREGATCLAVNCWNAAGTMFRLCIDLVTKSLLPEENLDGLNNRTRRSLGLRLGWMFENGYLPESIRELSDCVREDGNDGAHAGSLEKEDAEDLLDFTVILLERIYTEPTRIKLAAERREERRNPNEDEDSST